MNNFHDLIVNRRSIRKYTDRPLDPDAVKLILEAGLMAPCSKSSRAWQFVVVEEPEMLQRMSQCKPAGAISLTRAKVAIVVGIDPSKTEPWIEDASVAAAFMQLQAADLGIGSCWVQVRDRFTADGIPAQEYIQDLLGIPENIPVVCIITLGYKDEERKPNDLSKLKWENVHIEKWEERE